VLADLTTEWSPDGISWFPTGPLNVADPASGYQVELVIGPWGGYTLLPGQTSTTYIRVTTNKDIGISTGFLSDSVAVAVWQDHGAPYHWDVPADWGWILTQPPAYAGLINWDNPIKLDLQIWHTAELDPIPPKFFYTIQGAVNAASPGDTIYVYAGTYDGFNANKTGITVKAASAPVINGTGISIDGQLVGVLVSAHNVTIQGLIINGSYSTGIHIYNAATPPHGAKIKDNVIDQTWFDPAALPGVTWDGGAIYAKASGSTPTVISGNQIEFGSSSKPHNGIGTWDYTSGEPDYIISGNTINITVMPKYQVGINVRTGGSADITGNTIVCWDKNMSKWERVFGVWLAGMAPHNAKNIIVKGNTVTKMEYAVWISGPNADNITIMGNNLSGNRLAGVIIEDLASSVELTCNTIVNNKWGIYLDAETKAGKVTIHYNNIHSNTAYGVYNGGTEQADARYNWWGDATGPYHSTNLGGLGNPVSDNVIFSPWLLKKKVPPLVHDVAIIKVKPSQVRVVVGTIVTIAVTVENQGNTYETFDVTLSRNSTLIGTQTVTDLVPGKQKLLTFNWDTTGTIPGSTYTITAVASTVPGETETADNTKSADDKVRVGEPALLKVEPATYQAKRLNETFSINITVSNLKEYWRVIGYNFILTYNTTLLQKINVTEGPFFKRFGDTFFIVVQVDPIRGHIVMMGGVLLAPYADFPQGSGTIATVTFKAKYQERGLEKPPLSADLKLWDPIDKMPPMLIDDTEPDSLEIPLNIQHGRYEILPNNIGDVNWDYKVDINDIALAAKAFGSYLGHPRWNPIADITGPTLGVPDGKVDIRDIALIAKNFGWVQDP